MTNDSIAQLIQPYVGSLQGVEWRIVPQLSIFLDLILKWNARINLTAIRQPEEIVRRHFGESLFTAGHISNAETLLDFGSGAGFPGIPIQLVHPELKVTLAESQGKKSTFLREVIRTLALPTEVWAGRVEGMPIERRFDLVTLRAVDNMGLAIREAQHRANSRLLVLSSTRFAVASRISSEFRTEELTRMPRSRTEVLEAFVRI